MGLGAPELLVLVFPLILLGIGFAIWVLIDVRRYPVDAFARAGVNRTAWVAAPIVAITNAGSSRYTSSSTVTTRGCGPPRSAV